MTLDEAIKHAEEVADRCAVTDGNIQCENEHRQLAEWLKDYKRLLEQEPKTIQEIQAESEKYQKAFEDGYENGYAQARFDYEQEPILDDIRAEIEHMACRQYEFKLRLDREDVLKVFDKYIGGE